MKIEDNLHQCSVTQSLIIEQLIQIAEEGYLRIGQAIHSAICLYAENNRYNGESGLNHDLFIMGDDILLEGLILLKDSGRQIHKRKTYDSEDE